MDEKLKKGVLKYCPKCGAPIKEGSLFCEKCGFDLSKRKEKAPTKFSPKMIGIITIIAVVAVGGIYITFSGKGGLPATETPTQKPVGTVTQTTTPPLTTTPTPTTATPTTTPAPTTSPPTTTLTPTTPPATTPAPTHIILTGGMDEPLDDGKLYVVVWSVTKSDYGGYWVEVFFENSSKDNVLWKPIEIKIIDAKGDSYNCRFYSPYSYIKSGSKDYLSGVEQILDPDEGFRLVLEFPTGMYLPKTFILTNEYSDGSTTTWEIQLKL